MEQARLQAHSRPWDHVNISSPKLKELTALAREITEAVVRPNAEREDREAVWPAPAMRALGEAGLLGLNAPESAGGHGQGLTALAAVSEVIGSGSASAGLCFAMHCVGTAVIAAKATDYQHEHYLVPIARGEHVTSLAVSEPGTGIHFYLPQTRLSHEEDHLRVDGTKSFITNGGEADSYVVSTVATEESGREGEFSAVLIDAGSEGMRWRDAWAGLGMRGNSSRTVDLEGVRVPRENLLGEEGDQLWYVFEVVAPYFLTAMAGTYLGVAREAADIAREHLGSRRHSHSGELLGREPVLAHRLGELWIELERTGQLIYSAANRFDAGEDDGLLAVLSCKSAAAETAVLLTNEAMTLTGGSGYGTNSVLSRLLRDARASHVMSPSTDLLKTWVGRTLLNQPLI